MNLEELNLKFGEETNWCRTGRCGWCEVKINISEKTYLTKGNICEKCTSEINIKHIRNITDIKYRKAQMAEEIKEKAQERMEIFGEILNEEISEETRQVVVEKMQQEYKIIHSEIL